MLGALGWGLLADSTTSASAMPTEQGYCSATQVEAHMEPTDQGASVVRAAVEFTARPGQRCTLAGAPPATLQGAAGVPVARDQSGAADVTLDATHAAHVELSWPVAGRPAQQVTPRSVTLEMPSVRGDSVVVPWRGGRIDGPGAHGHVTVRPAAPGFAVGQAQK